MKRTQMYKCSPLFILLFFITASCQKDNENQIPNVAVNEVIYLTNPSYIDLQAVGGWEYVSGGSRGILVYRKSQDEFMAYDRHCPYQPANSCGKVAVDSTNIIAVDACCGSEFLITDGSVAKGPASLPLKRYNTSFDGSVLQIYN